MMMRTSLWKFITFRATWVAGVWKLIPPGVGVAQAGPAIARLAQASAQCFKAPPRMIVHALRKMREIGALP
jgi:hypothetical protein